MQPSVQVKELLGSLVGTIRDGPFSDGHLPRARVDTGEVLGTRCVHPGGQLKMLGHARICLSWDQILGSRSRPMQIRPTKCEWELDGHGRARVTLVEYIAPGGGVHATNAYVILNGTWRMVTHVAS